ncbi:MAG: FAD-binding oxidoreductase [Deltaproteobacteria bacterium]|nr:FAD-binding oxidoreductase [Deltaproteobacteria bacterium]
MEASELGAAVAELAAKLRRVVGDGNVLDDARSRHLYSIDFSELPGEEACLVVRPGSTPEVSEVVGAASSAGFAILARGGAMSYTLGHVPARPDSVVLDMARMNRVVEVNTADGYVIVEAGVTWKQLREALQSEAYHVPFYGTLSGVLATIGGGLGNMATALGKGDITDDLLGLEVVLPDGQVLGTGCLVKGRGAPTLRQFGPDLTGLFVADGGAFGVKTRAVFRLLKRPGGAGYASFGFPDRHGAVAALCEIARSELATELFAFGRYHNEQIGTAPKPSREESRQFVQDLFRMSSSRVRAARDLLRCLRPGGMGFLAGQAVSLHVVADGFDQRSADRKIAAAKRVAARCGGVGLPPSLAVTLRVAPFMPVDKLILGTNGTCSIPSHCVVPYSRAAALVSALERFFAENATLMAAQRIEHTMIYFRTGGRFGVEPILYWPDSLSSLRLSILDPERREALSQLEPNPAARQAALDLRRRLVDAFIENDGGYAQIGKYYPYRERLGEGPSWQVLEKIKAALDAGRTMNPGALGLG